MQLRSYGGARTVTGSQHLLTVNGTNILLECGLFQGRRSETYKRNLKFQFDASSIDVLLLSHAHIDHSGNIPNLVKNGFYDEARFFRYVPNFIVQFGMHADPRVSKLWGNQQIKDDPVTRTNRKGSITFAKTGAPNSRTSQVFVNLKANAFLDSQGFAPFGRVVEGMDIVEGLYSGYGEAPEQGMIRNQGNKYLISRFPKLDFIKTGTIEE